MWTDYGYNDFGIVSKKKLEISGFVVEFLNVKNLKWDDYGYYL